MIQAYLIVALEVLHWVVPHMSCDLGDGQLPNSFLSAFMVLCLVVLHIYAASQFMPLTLG